MTKAKPIYLWDSRRGSSIGGILALLICYVVGSRAIDTGSLIQYFLAIVLLVIGINRLVRAIRNK